ncbi:release factor glutamine methyltransferase, partial [Striga asiatica]
MFPNDQAQPSRIEQLMKQLLCEKATLPKLLPAQTVVELVPPPIVLLHLCSSSNTYTYPLLYMHYLLVSTLSTRTLGLVKDEVILTSDEMRARRGTFLWKMRRWSASGMVSFDAWQAKVKSISSPHGFDFSMVKRITKMSKKVSTDILYGVVKVSGGHTIQAGPSLNITWP